MNAFVKIFYAGLAALFLPLVAVPGGLAEDLAEAVPEIVIASPSVGGWYLRGDLGYSWSKFKKADYSTDNSGAGASGFNDRFYGDLKGSFLIGGGAGYQVADYFRTDFTLDYMTRARFEASCGGDTGCGMEGSGHLSALSVLANAYVDLGNFAGFTPYIGAGLGGTHIKWADLHHNAGTLEGAANWRFTYALMAGASVDLTHNLKLDAGYRYRHVNGGKMFEGNSALGDGHDKGMGIHDIRIGLRYMFDR
ncbi:porin family protein [Falsochrobactrum shanghaiense]|uniref:Porin family protein n=1 Tax=Falsochrobactrum shanghaiense TaxID=2201899 RepID=A0A316J6F5_9HYPH|nr:outer membrane protein [Falsochrobactrum shanghaiense]PWL16891.1 porin family protein [Falsochrobactrum shanghaiense]